MQVSPCDELSTRRKIDSMTTRAGSAGLLTGLITTMFLYLFFAAWPDAYLHGWSTGSTGGAWVAVAVVVILTIGGGMLAVRWGGSAHPVRCAVLGGLAGGLAGTIVFCLWGAATAGLARWTPPFDLAANEAVRQPAQVEIVGAITRQTLGMFLTLFLGGCGLGALGGWLACPRQRIQADGFDKAAPQMALNASITAVPAAIVAAALAAAIFTRLADFVGMQAGDTVFVRSFVDIPLAVSLLLVLISQFALTLVIPHEARQAEHRSGMDEVKMAAYVGIGAAPALFLLLYLIKPDLLSNSPVTTALLASTGLSLVSLRSLFRLVLPRRASFPAPQAGWQKTEASLFGTIAHSRGPRLVVLCIGCGLMMVLPLYVSVLSVLINLTNAPASADFTQPGLAGAGRLFLIQALVSTGLMTASIVALSAIYLFYLGLGRWFSKWNSSRSS
jgi:hypothetical protein